ncbi:hypothetical protein [Paenibacillus sp. PK1-4R]|uniref:hypothetical protein n=1 Tax=Paenibacillus sp. PK1-4R TaxID=3049075 RepID=UPI00259FF92E|nr:hypothetical protein [Paenibacillus sp. PK1-4R]WJM10602.1 hypothetical protein QNO02_11980 [Paenibacillus sp. PK1-4R]
MLSEFIELEEESDESYRCYTLQNTVQIFKHLIQDEDLNDVRIYVSTNTPLDSMVHKIEDYIKWFSICETVFREYYENELQEKVHQNWFNEIEVYRADITFNSITDYGATISCGDHILLDHIMMIDFDREQIQAIHLNG